MKKNLSRTLIQKERQRRASPPSFSLSYFLFEKQLEFVNDKAPFKIAVCSRRAGKTVSCAAHLVDTAINNQGVTCVYITLSRNNAKKIIWKEIKEINRKFSLGGVPNQTELTIQFPNGSSIYLSGAKDSTEIEKFRGLAIKLCYIDEGQSFRSYLEGLINDVIAPALMDYGGTLCLIGSPGPVPTGFFHQCATVGEAWSKHAWTYFDNPHIITKSGLTHKQLLNRELVRRGVAVTDPSVQREWFGKWEPDTDSLLIHYTQGVNNYEALPGNVQPSDWVYILGIDLGYNDADALAVLAWNEKDPVTYLVEEVVTNKQGITELVEQITNLDKKYKLSKMVCDTGGLGKKIAEELIRRHSLPIVAADKVRKMENVSFLNDALRTGRFKAKDKSRFAEDSYLVEVDREKTTPDKIRVKDTYHSDIIDAVLYAFKESPAFGYTPPVKKTVPYTKPWYDEEAKRLEEAAEKYFAELSNKPKDYWED